MTFLYIILCFLSFFSCASDKYRTEIIFNECQHHCIGMVDIHKKFIDRMYSILTHKDRSSDVYINNEVDEQEKCYHYSFTADSVDIYLSVKPADQKVVINIYDDSDDREYVFIGLIGQYFFESNECLVKRQD